MTNSPFTKRLDVVVINPDGTPTGKVKRMIPSNTLFRMKKQRPRVYWDGKAYELEPHGDGWALRLHVRPKSDNPENTQHPEVAHGDVE